MTEKNPHLQELGQFLRARRSEVDPTELGLPTREDHIRRVAGLRREEVAAAVSISHDYYTRLEQGRLAPSEPVLAAIAHALRLSPTQRTYAENLARQAERRTPPRPRTTPIRPQIQRLLDQLTDTPAFVVGKYLDILAWNPLASELLLDIDQRLPRDRNFLRILFTDPRMKDYYEDWESMARANVALLRVQAVDNPDDPRLAALVGELSVAHPLFRRLWADHLVAWQEHGTKTIRHPEHGAFTIDWDAFQWSGDPHQTLIMWSAEPGSATHDKLRIIASWLQASPSRQNMQRNSTDT